LPALLHQAAAHWRGRSAIVDGDTTLGYDAVLARSRQVARALVALGVQAGDRVAVWAPNMHEWILAACGIHAAGAVLLPLNTRLKGPEAADILARSRACVLLCIGEFLGQSYPALLDGLLSPALRHVVVLRAKVDPAHAPPGHLDWDHFLAAGAAVDPAVVEARVAALGPDSVSDLMFTSGTTGRPKGVMACHGPTIRAFAAWSEVVGLREDDHYLIVNPFFHTFGYKAGWVAAFLRGATVFPEQVFDAGRLLARIAHDQISFLPGPPTIYQGLLAHPMLAEHDLSSLRSAVTGASTVPPVLIRRMQEELGIRNVTTAYGLTECGGCATINEPDDSVETIASTCGHPIPGTTLRCVDANGRVVPVGEPGEVQLRGYHVMNGYFEDADGTRAAIDDEGWLHTGDIGVLDARGYLRITDRLKDMYIAGGFNCYPAEIERVLSEHPAVAQVAVVGVPDERLGEVGCACLILRSDSPPLDTAGFVAWARERLANYKLPRHVMCFEAFPLNVANKVLKRDLLALAIDRLRTGSA
jgi:acyl-CoA synthetase (AMP-forming)/AMP-acid ligase II